MTTEKHNIILTLKKPTPGSGGIGLSWQLLKPRNGVMTVRLAWATEWLLAQHTQVREINK